TSAISLPSHSATMRAVRNRRDRAGMRVTASCAVGLSGLAARFAVRVTPVNPHPLVQCVASLFRIAEWTFVGAAGRFAVVGPVSVKPVALAFRVEVGAADAGLATRSTPPGAVLNAAANCPAPRGPHVVGSAISRVNGWLPARSIAAGQVAKRATKPR